MNAYGLSVYQGLNALFEDQWWHNNEDAGDMDAYNEAEFSASIGEDIEDKIERVLRRWNRPRPEHGLGGLRRGPGEWENERALRELEAYVSSGYEDEPSAWLVDQMDELWREVDLTDREIDYLDSFSSNTPFTEEGFDGLLLAHFVYDVLRKYILRRP